MNFVRMAKMFPEARSHVSLYIPYLFYSQSEICFWSIFRNIPNDDIENVVNNQ